MRDSPSGAPGPAGLPRGDGHGPTLHPDGTTTFRVWAPRAERVTLAVGGRESQMAPGERGWFSARAQAAHGDDYGFSLDGAQLRPDPASRWQPEGVHGLSRLLDLSTLAWPENEARWQPAPLDRAVLYELHVGAFTPEGTLDAAAARVDGLADLGVTHVELMPITAFNGPRGWGYDRVYWRAVHEPYGGPAALGRFVASCHRAGLAVVLDVVYNHLGPSGNYLPEFGPYLTDRYKTPWGDAINVDGPGSDEVRGLIIGSALGWLADFHVDGLRLDAVHALFDNSATHLLAELSGAVDRLSDDLGRPLALIAECDRNDPATIRPRAEHGRGMHALWADDLHHALHSAATGERDGYYADFSGLTDVAAAYRHGFVYGGRYSPARQRTVGAPLPDDRTGSQLVGCLQNHDQVGNRARGERLTALAPPALVRACIVMLCAAPHLPLLFMGEEHAAQTPFLYFTSHPEPELADAVRAGRRKEFAAFTAFGAEVPDPQDPTTFAASKLDWTIAASEVAQQRRALWRDLLALRRSQPALSTGQRDLIDTLIADDRSLAVLRRDPLGASDILIAVNLTHDDVQRGLPVEAGDWDVLLTSDHEGYGGRGAAATMGEAGDGAALRLPAESATLLARRTS